MLFFHKKKRLLGLTIHTKICYFSARIAKEEKSENNEK